VNSIDTTWGSWSLNWDGTALCHDGGYRIELHEISDVDWWAEHLRGKDWATPEVVADFYRAVAAVKGMLADFKTRNPRLFASEAEGDSR
jgi:hypothetical protein